MINKKRGISLIAAIFIMVIFLLLGTTLITMLSNDSISSARQLNFMKAHYAAEAGITYTAERILLNDYDWRDNDVGTVGMVDLPAYENGYPTSVSPTYPWYKGNAGYSRIQRTIDDANFSVFVTSVNESAGWAPSYLKDISYPEAWLWPECTLKSNGQYAGSSTRITQRIRKFQHPGLYYAMAAMTGEIDFTPSEPGSEVHFSHPLDHSPFFVNPASLIANQTISIYTSPVPIPIGNHHLFPSRPPDKAGQNWYPVYCDTDNYKKFAVQTINDWDIIPQGVIHDGLIYCKGSVIIGDSSLPGRDVVVDGSIIAENNIIISEGFNLTVNSNPGSFLPDVHLPAMVAGANIFYNGTGIGTLEVNGLVYCGGDEIKLKTFLYMNPATGFRGVIGTMTFNGGVYSKKDIILDTPRLYINYDPRVRLTYGVYAIDPSNYGGAYPPTVFAYGSQWYDKNHNSKYFMNNELVYLDYNEELMH